MADTKISHLHSDNGVFTAGMFHEDCKFKPQSQSFSGVRAKHQNSLAERTIQTIMYTARTYIVHVSLQHAAWVQNSVPKILLCLSLTPLELLTETKPDHRDLLHSHVWGCPVFVLDPKLQDGKEIPKCNRRS